LNRTTDASGLSSPSTAASDAFRPQSIRDEKAWSSLLAACQSECYTPAAAGHCEQVRAASRVPGPVRGILDLCLVLRQGLPPHTYNTTSPTSRLCRLGRQRFVHFRARSLHRFSVMPHSPHALKPSGVLPTPDSDTVLCAVDTKYVHIRCETQSSNSSFSSLLLVTHDGAPYRW